MTSGKRSAQILHEPFYTCEPIGKEPVRTFCASMSLQQLARPKRSRILYPPGWSSSPTMRSGVLRSFSSSSTRRPACTGAGTRLQAVYISVQAQRHCGASRTHLALRVSKRTAGDPSADHDEVPDLQFPEPPSEHSGRYDRLRNVLCAINEKQQPPLSHRDPWRHHHRSSTSPASSWDSRWSMGGHAAVRHGP